MQKTKTTLTILLFVLAAGQTSLAWTAEESEAANANNVTKTLVWPDGTRYVGGVVDGKGLAKGQSSGRMAPGLWVSLKMTCAMVPAP